jgi:hypothetical protein
MSNPDFQNGFVAGYSVGRASSPSSGQVDYIQNDSTAKDYIKNRPFYEFDGALNIDLPECHDSVSVQGSIGLVVGNTYTVFDGENYEDVEAIDFSSEIGFSVVGIMGSTFLIIDALLVDDEDYIYDSGYYTYQTAAAINVTGTVEPVKRIHGKFLPKDVITTKALQDTVEINTDYRYSVENLADDVLFTNSDLRTLMKSVRMVQGNNANMETYYSVCIEFTVFAATVKNNRVQELVVHPFEVAKNDSGYYSLNGVSSGLIDCAFELNGETLKFSEIVKEFEGDESFTGVYYDFYSVKHSVGSSATYAIGFKGYLYFDSKILEVAEAMLAEAEGIISAISHITFTYRSSPTNLVEGG